MTNKLLFLGGVAAMCVCTSVDAKTPIRPRWMYFAADAQQPARAVYGVPNSTADLMVACGRRGMLEVSVGPVMDQKGRARAAISSGGTRYQTRTTLVGEEESYIEFLVPLNSPVVASMTAKPLIVSFENGERNPFPAGAPMTKIIRSCS